MSDSSVSDIGHTLCTALDHGANYAQVLTTLVTSVGAKMEQANGFATASMTYLCPARADVLPWGPGGVADV